MKRTVAVLAFILALTGCRVYSTHSGEVVRGPVKVSDYDFNGCRGWARLEDGRIVEVYLPMATCSTGLPSRHVRVTEWDDPIGTGGWRRVDEFRASEDK